MLMMYLKLVFSFSLIDFVFLSRTILERSLEIERRQCQIHWHYLSVDETCVLFATSQQQGDLNWTDSVQACQANSAHLFNIKNSNDLSIIERKLQEKPKYTLYFQKGAWIGNATWSTNDLCDPFDDIQSNCFIIIKDLYDQRLCLRSVSCNEYHPFICQTQAMTEDEFEENNMVRGFEWSCLFSFVACLIDDANTEQKNAAEEQRQLQARAAQAAEKQAYIDQFNFTIPSDKELQTKFHSASALTDSSQSQMAGFSPLYLVVGAIALMFFIFTIASAFNETCGPNLPECIQPLTCHFGRCLCSIVDQTTNKTIDKWFWTGSECLPCPTDYNTTFLKCYKVYIADNDQMNWARARARCQQSRGDLLVIRSSQEYDFFLYHLQNRVKVSMMHQRTPNNATYFASFWLGITLLSWLGNGIYQSTGSTPILDKKSSYWCGHSSPLDQEPNFTGLKQTGERQECVGLAVFPGGIVCLHDWFCSWDSYFVCEISLSADNSTEEYVPTVAALAAEQPNNLNVYVFIGIGGFVLILISIGIYFMCFKSKKIQNTDSNESTLSDL